MSLYNQISAEQANKKKRLKKKYILLDSKLSTSDNENETLVSV